MDESPVGEHGAASDFEAIHIATSLCQYARPVKPILSPKLDPWNYRGIEAAFHAI